jgi:short-subunit dehydrogenase
MGGRITFPLGSLYHGTKFSVEGISESLRYEVEQIGCKVKIIEPGMIATDFSGRSFDFHHDVNLSEYQKIVDKISTAFTEMIKKASPASIVADLIYEAATDGKNKLRYIAGNDAKAFILFKKLFGYNFIVGMNKKFFKL